MKRREFIAYTGLTTAAVLSSGLIRPAFSFDASSVSPEKDVARRMKSRMHGGRCHDHRFMVNEPTPAFEREIFGI